MKIDAQDAEANGTFPPAPVEGSAHIAPIRSWAEMFQETQITGVEFEEFWYESVEEGVAYFFSWLGNPRCTVLVVWDEKEPTCIECRKVGDQLVTEIEGAPIHAEVTQLFRSAGFWQSQATH
ncbi:MAG: hypothetical protein U1E09_14290 [Methylococcales bacterium]|nr:hypothetical protein [Methylococcales bacterium]